MNGRSLLIGALALTACDEKDYAGLEFDVISAPPVPVSVETDAIELEVGLAVMVDVQPISTDEPYGKGDSVALSSEDPEILDVFSGDRARRFVLVGQNVGRTCLEVRINRSREDCIAVEVRDSSE